MVSVNSQTPPRKSKDRGSSRRSRARNDDSSAKDVTGPTVDELRYARTMYFDNSSGKRPSRQPDKAHQRHQSETRPRHNSVLNDNKKKHRKGASLREEYLNDYVQRREDIPRPDHSSQRNADNRTRKERTERSSSHTHSKQPGVVVAQANTPAPSPRPRLDRSASASQAKPSSSSRPTVTRRDTVGAASSKRDQNRTSFLGTLFRTASTPAGKAARTHTVDCLTCGSDSVPIDRCAKLACGHRMCNSCLRRIFTMSVKDEAHMPPRCCTSEHIPLKYVDDLFDTKFKLLWNKKYQEYTTKNRIYCPKPGCGTWIRPGQIHTESGRKFGLCGKCRTKTCIKCNRKWHRRSECPKDDETEKFVAVAQENGWRRCPDCSRMIEKSEGCNHMTCICTSEWCMVCGAKWKTCECPWFDYAQVQDEDRFNPMRNIIPIIRRRFFGDAEQAAGRPEPRRQEAAPRPAQNNNNPALPYQQEADRRRRQIQRDEAIARRLQLDALRNNEAAQQRQTVDQEAFGNAGEHFLNENFVREAASVIGGPAVQGASYGRRGERESGRRRGPRNSLNLPQDTGLAPNAFGTESLIGFAPPPPPPPPAPLPAQARRGGRRRLSSVSNRAEDQGGGDFMGRWLSKLG